ncbi:MAG: class F sortase [Actinomycetota bacterium]
MTNPETPAGGRRPPLNALWWLVVVLLVLIGAGMLSVSLFGRTDPLTGTASPTPHLSQSPPTADPATTTPPPTHPATPSAKPKGTSPVRQSGLAMARSGPVSLRIPAIGVSLRLSTLGLNPDGTVQVPGRDQAPGWFRLGPTPGQIGSAVILGHVDDYRGPAAFYRLRSLRPGDKVDVSLADGAVAHFAVTTVASYLKSQFPAQKVYASHGDRALQLVTCGGQFDSGTGHYLSNVVVYTSLVATTPPGQK